MPFVIADEIDHVLGAEQVTPTGFARPRGMFLQTGYPYGVWRGGIDFWSVAALVDNNYFSLGISIITVHHIVRGVDRGRGNPVRDEPRRSGPGRRDHPLQSSGL